MSYIIFIPTSNEWELFSSSSLLVVGFVIFFLNFLSCRQIYSDISSCCDWISLELFNFQNFPDKASSNLWITVQIFLPLALVPTAVSTCDCLSSSVSLILGQWFALYHHLKYPRGSWFLKLFSFLNIVQRYWQLLSLHTGAMEVWIVGSCDEVNCLIENKLTKYVKDFQFYKKKQRSLCQNIFPYKLEKI